MKLRKRKVPVYIDIFIIILTCFICFFIEKYSLGDFKNTVIWKLVMISSVNYITILYIANGYYTNLRGNEFSISKDILSIIKGLLISLIIIGAIFTINVSWRKPEYFIRLILSCSILLITLSIIRYLEYVFYYRGKKIAVFITSRNCTIVDEIKNDLLKYKRNNWVIFKLDKENIFKMILGNDSLEKINLDDDFFRKARIEGSMSALHRFFLNNEYIPIIVTDQSISQDSIICRFLVFCFNHQIPVISIFDFFENICQKAAVFVVEGKWIWDYCYLRYSSLNYIMKRIFDIILVCLLLPMALPVGIIIALLIKIESREPFLFVQKRTGMRAKVFNMYKFRTMITHPDDSAQWPKIERNLITRVGRTLRKTGLDEIPQLINILKGDMSFVGPRPARPEVAKMHCANIPFFALTHSVLPGITGWAQLHQGTDSGYNTILERVRYNMYYLKKYSMWMDLYIIIRTAKMIFHREKPTPTYEELKASS